MLPLHFRTSAPQIFILMILAGLLSSGYAQEHRTPTRADTTDLIPRLEPILDSFSSTEDRAGRVAEQFARLKDNPLDLNQASSADLSLLPGLSPRVAQRIVYHRSDQGPFQSLSSMQNVEGVTKETVRAVRPFLTVSPESESVLFPSVNAIVSNLDVRWIQTYTRRLELGRGYQTGRFLGPPGRLTSRFRLEHERRLQLALTLDKDPGEPLQWSPSTDTYGFDHVVGSLTLRNIGPVQTVILGDFSAQFGQGVALWQGIRFGKGRDPVSPILQEGRGVRPYQSASESNFFRGAATTVDLPANLSLTAFASRRARDASLDSSTVSSGTSSPPIPARTISSGGLHRTPSERARKSTFRETTIGGALEYQSSSLHLGATSYHARFNRPLRPGDKPYRQFRVSGQNTSTVSTYGTAYLGNYTLFGEATRTASGSYGGILGGAVDFGTAGQAIVLGRRYPPRLAPFHGNALGNGGRPQNEIGVYTGLRLHVAPNWTIGAYFDQYSAPWLRFNMPRPSAGWEARAVVEYDPRPWLSTYLQIRVQSEDESTEHLGPGNRAIDGLRKNQRHSARWHMEYAFSDALSLRTRTEFSRYRSRESVAEGFFLSQGVRWRPHPSLQLDARIAFFDTDGFAARIYAYEHDLLYSFSVPVFFDRGRRSYVLVEYDPFPALTLEAKFGITSYDNRDTIGSGLNEIEGSRRRDLRLQVQWTL
jgi:hypothetical protein